MTTATTILALTTVLTSTGRCADVMVPMAIPSVGGMFMVLLTLFVVPVTYCLIKELRFKLGIINKHSSISSKYTKKIQKDKDK